MGVKSFQIILMLVLFNQTVFSQKSDHSFSAEFVYGNNELDSFIIDNFIRPRFCLEKGVDFDIWMQFTVDSLSGISFVRVMDIQTTYANWSELFKLKIDSLKPQLKAEAVRVITETAGFWIPKEIDGKPTWEIIDYRIEIRTPEYYSDRKNQIGFFTGSALHSYIPLDDPSDNPVKYYNLGVKKMNKKKHYIAIKYFEKSIGMGNKTKDVYYNLGVAEHLYGLKDDACKSWSAAAELGDAEAQGLIDKNCK